MALQLVEAEVDLRPSRIFTADFMAPRAPLR